MKTIFKMTLGLMLFANAAHAGDEVKDGRVIPKEDEQFCMTDPSTDKEVCVAKDQKDELVKKLKKDGIKNPDDGLKPGLMDPRKQKKI